VAKPPVVYIDDLGLQFQTPGGTLQVLEHISLSVADGEFLVLLGPSGCGKSTLLNVIAGTLHPTSGTMLFESAPLKGVNRGVGYLTQDDTLLPWRTVENNIGIALELQFHREAAGRKEELVRSLIDLVGLRGFEKYHPGQLSGGMRKRVALARSLIYDPALLLMDEPFGALDAQLKIVMQNELLRIWERTRKTVVFVTHDLGEAIALADRVAVFSKRPGTIKDIVEIDLPRPRNATEIHRLARFGELHERLWNLLDVSVDEQAGP
jgi:NitT/TauT family transport system ATP-binding protein